MSKNNSNKNKEKVTNTKITKATKIPPIFIQSLNDNFLVSTKSINCPLANTVLYVVVPNLSVIVILKSHAEFLFNRTAGPCFS